MRSDILICECAHTAHPGTAKIQAILAGLKAAGIPCTAVPDLCGMAARKDPLLKQFAASSNLQVLACYPRTIKALFQFAGAPLASANPQIINLREVSAETALAQVLGGAAEEMASSPRPAPSEEEREKHGERSSPLSTECGDSKLPSFPAAAAPEWVPWFPVLDLERCTQCQQCLSFCLFGVYSLSPEGTVTVENPQACKTNCPACARICPQAAIIFPKYESGVVAGAEVTDASLEQSLVKADLSKMLGGDVYESLALRRRKARSQPLLRTDLAKARDERKEFLEEAGLGHLLNAEVTAPESPPTADLPPAPLFGAGTACPRDPAPETATGTSCPRPVHQGLESGTGCNPAAPPTP